MTSHIALNSTLLARLLDGRYLLNGVIGRGGSAIVYRGQLTRDPSREVAIKVFSGTPNAEMRNIVETEMAIARVLRHPNLVRLFEVLEGDGVIALVLEYVKLGELSALIYPKLALTISESIEILLGIAGGLNALHQNGFIHCDLTARNILLSAQQTPKISDFSNARHLNSLRNIKDRSRQHGTFDYVSPEFLARGELSQAHDVYSIGVLAYELTTGRLPFSGAHIAEKMSLKLSTLPHPPIALRPDCPSDLSNAIMSTLAIEPKNRLRSVKLFERKLVEALFQLDPQKAEQLKTNQSLGLNSQRIIQTVINFFKK